MDSSVHLCNTLGTSKAEVENDFYPDHTFSAASTDTDGSLDDAPHTFFDLEPIPQGGERNGGGGTNAKGKGSPGWSASAAQLGWWMGMPAAGGGTVSHFPLFFLLMIAYPTRTPRKSFGGINPYRGGAMAGSGMLAGEIAVSSNLGKIGDWVRFLKFNITLRLTKLYYSPCGC